MFGPNTHLTTRVDVRESHRDQSTKALIRNLRQEFRQQFQLFDYELIFLLGGGSLGVESLIYSSRLPVTVNGVDGAFTTRWKNLASIYNAKKSSENSSSSLGFYCQLETSLSAQQFFDGGAIDAVSSFPYLAIPPNTPAFVTSSNKLLGSMVGLSIIGIARSSIGDLILDEDESYLSIAKYLRYISDDQTPSTTSVHNLHHLLSTIQTFDLTELRRRIELISDLIVSTVGKAAVIGDTKGPVITILKEFVPQALIDKWELYQKPTAGGVVQIFTYSCPVSAYEDFCADYVAAT